MNFKVESKTKVATKQNGADRSQRRFAEEEAGGGGNC